MKVNEIFYSLQGEGLLAGRPSVFIRLAGCPLKCKWCDTKYAWSDTAGDDYTIDKIIHEVERYNCLFVVITGGEPMIHDGINKLAEELKARKMHITIETAGITFIPDLPCDLMSISPKLSNSTPTELEFTAIHEDLRLDLAILTELIDNYKYQLKFVVDSQDDLPEINQTINKLGNVDRSRVILMPQAAARDDLIAKSPMVAEMCKTTGFIFGMRLQTLLWNNQKGT